MQGRFHPDLPADAERALRAAGALYHSEALARDELKRARELAPEHLAVWIAHYRFHFYQHRYVEAEECARKCIALVSARLGLPSDLLLVEGNETDFTVDDPGLRFWLFAWQAYGYVLLRLDQDERALQVLQKLCQLDARDITKTQILLSVILQRETDAE